MKTAPQHRWTFLSNLIISPLTLVMLLSGSSAIAQTFSNMYNFSALVGGTNADGAMSYSALVLSGHTLYGTARIGGNGYGTIFGINTDGSGFTNVHYFSVPTGTKHTNIDGVNPLNGMALSGNTLFGLGALGGTNGTGAAFAVTTDGLTVSNLHSFSAPTGDGIVPECVLLLSSNLLYGTASAGGSNSLGMVFRMNSDGSTYTNLHNFSSTDVTSHTNADGAQPIAGLVQSSNYLYGVTTTGGAGASGAIFRMNTDGSGFTNLHSFGTLVNKTNSDGTQCFSSLVLGGNALYGVAGLGGVYSNGTVFRINLDGTGFTNLHNFAPIPGNLNAEGAQPFGTPVLSGNTLYGTATAGGPYTNGTIFSLKTDGTGFTVLYSFSSLTNGTNSDGGAPVSLLLSSNVLYGVSHWGGAFGNGGIFSLAFPSPPALHVAASGANVILSWPTNAPAFALESTPSLVPPTTWNTNYPAPAVVGAQFVLTNPIAGPRIFYRLNK